MLLTSPPVGRGMGGGVSFLGVSFLGVSFLGVSSSTADGRGAMRTRATPIGRGASHGDPGRRLARDSHIEASNLLEQQRQGSRGGRASRHVWPAARPRDLPFPSLAHHDSPVS